MKHPFLLAGFAALLAGCAARADLQLPSIIGDNMVLQRNQDGIPIWGWASPGTKVTVDFAGQTVEGKAGENGRWEVKLAALKASSGGLEMKISAGGETINLGNVLVGEVWLCSGQSNMQWAVSQSYDSDLESLTAKYPNMRLISVPRNGTQELQNDFSGSWEGVTPEAVQNFSAVGYYFGRQLHQTLDVPVGLIDNAWGGSAAEAWVRRDVLEADPNYAEYVAHWKKIEETYDHAAVMEKWKAAAVKAKAEGKRPPRQPQDQLSGQHRPGNLYAGVLHPIIGYGIRGVIWYQGETNAPRAWNYRELFPRMISHWREEWGQGEFPFYWVQLADFRDEQTEPVDAEWPVLREAQTHALKLPNTGQAVIYDLGEGRNIHPKNKQGVARRLARIALARDYGHDLAHLSPTWQSHEVKGKTIEVTFKDVGAGGLYSFDRRNPVGFAVAGEDRVFCWAAARIVGKDKVVVSSDKVPNPVAVRYAWADNPVANLRSSDNLPVVPFRTDDWKVATQPGE